MYIVVGIYYTYCISLFYRFRKAEIGQPTEFRHISHVGFDQDKGLSFNDKGLGVNVEDNLNQFLKLVSNSALLKK